jgi:hypothetical protein
MITILIVLLILILGILWFLDSEEKSWEGY